MVLALELARDESGCDDGSDVAALPAASAFAAVVVSLDTYHGHHGNDGSRQMVPVPVDDAVSDGGNPHSESMRLRLSLP